MIIAFEGIDFSGKTTQITLLSTEYKFNILSFPRKENRIIWDYLTGKNNIAKESSFFFFLADIIDGIYKSEEPLLLDRYVYSTIAYAKAISFENARRIVELSPAREADIVFYLNLSLEEYKRRIEKENNLDEYEKNLSFIERVKERYEVMKEEQFFAKKWVEINASLSVDEIHKKIKSHLNL